MNRPHILQTIALVSCVIPTSLFAFQNPSPQTGPDEEARKVAQEVFSSEDYWWKRTGELETPGFFDKVGRWISDNILEPIARFFVNILKWIWEHLFFSPSGYSGNWAQVSPLAWLLLFAVVAWLVWHIVIVLRKQTIVTSDNVIASDSPESLPNSRILLDQAQLLLTKGDYQAAMRQAFLSLIAWLQEEGRLRYDPSRSNREYQRDLGQDQELRASFRAAATPYERCWYGGHPSTAEQVQEVLAICRRHVKQGGPSHGS